MVNESKKTVVSASQTVRYIYLENLWKLPDRISFVSNSAALLFREGTREDTFVNIT